MAFLNDGRPLNKPFSLETWLFFGVWGDLLGTGGRRVGVLSFRRLEVEPGRIVSHQLQDDHWKWSGTRIRLNSPTLISIVQGVLCKRTGTAVATETNGTENPTGLPSSSDCMAWFSNRTTLNPCLKALCIQNVKTSNSRWRKKSASWFPVNDFKSFF